jgi:hypothetical protein
MKQLYAIGHEANPKAGRPRGSVRSIKGMLSRFIARKLSPKQLSRLFDKLSERDQAYFLIQCLPYVAARENAEAISPEEIEKLFSKLETALNAKNEIRTA